MLDRSAFLNNMAMYGNETTVSNNDGLLFFFPCEIIFVLKMAMCVASHMLEYVEIKSSPKVIAIYPPNANKFLLLF